MSMILYIVANPEKLQGLWIRFCMTISRRYGYMTLADYAMATGQSKSAASKDLNRLVKDPDSGITARGEHSHKIWVDSKARL